MELPPTVCFTVRHCNSLRRVYTFVVKIEEQDAEKDGGRYEISEASTKRSDLPISAILSCSMHAIRSMLTALNYAFPYAWETFICRGLNSVKARLGA